MANSVFAANNKLFRASCELAKVPPTKRQASKFCNEKGAAFKRKGEAKRALAKAENVEQVDAWEQMHQPSKNHPEKLPGEMWLTNSGRDEGLLNPIAETYKSMRVGVVALDTYGKVAETLVPVFVSIEEYEARMKKHD